MSYQTGRRLKVSVKTEPQDVPENDPSIEFKDAPQLTQSTGFLSSPGNAQAIGVAGNMVGQQLDPQGTHMGPAISDAATGAATGASVGGPYGAAIGGAIGLGLGLLTADQKRTNLANQLRLKGADALAAGADKAAAADERISFKFGSRSGSYRKNSP